MARPTKVSSALPAAEKAARADLLEAVSIALWAFVDADLARKDIAAKLERARELAGEAAKLERLLRNARLLTGIAVSKGLRRKSLGQGLDAGGDE